MEYELTVLIHPDHEADLEKSLAAVRELIKSSGGTVKKEDSWGKKRLAYRIKKQDFALYVHFELSLPSEAPLKISNTLNITDAVLRYLLVKTDEKERAKLAAAKKDTGDEETEE